MALEADTIRSMSEVQAHTLHGRRMILTGEGKVTRENVMKVLNRALNVHLKNRAEEVYLENYARGIQPILTRTKDVRSEINNKVVVNIANQILAFKVAMFAGEPIQYISRGNRDNVPGLVAQLNNLMLSEGKESKDIEMAEQMFTCGVGYRLVVHDRGGTGEDYLDEAPFEIHIPDSKNTFVVRLNDVTKRPVMGCTYVSLDEPEGGVRYTVYTEDATYTIDGTGSEGQRITDVTVHRFGMVPLVEYPCNPMRMGAFEVVLPMLDAINLTQSNRLDGIEQFIQAIMVFEGVDISREQFLELKDLGALKLPPTMDGRTSRVYYLNEQLDQSQTQTLVDDMYQTVLQIVGMPSQGNANTSDSSNNGAVIMKNGWWNAEARAQEAQGMWKAAETEFLKIVLKICADTNTLTGLRISDLKPKFWRQSYEDTLVKTQSFSTLIAAGCPPIQAYTHSHMSRDPESDAQAYNAFQEEKALELDAEAGVTSTGTVTAVAGTADGAEGSQTGTSAATGVCPICGRSFRKNANNQKYDRQECRDKAHHRGQYSDTNAGENQ